MFYRRGGGHFQSNDHSFGMSCPTGQYTVGVLVRCPHWFGRILYVCCNFLLIICVGQTCRWGLIAPYYTCSLCFIVLYGERAHYVLPDILTALSPFMIRNWWEGLPVMWLGGNGNGDIIGNSTFFLFCQPFKGFWRWYGGYCIEEKSIIPVKHFPSFLPPDILCFSFPGSKRFKEGPTSCTTQVRIASGHLYHESLGISLPSWRINNPRRALDFDNSIILCGFFFPPSPLSRSNE